VGFEYRDDQLFCEDVAIERIVAEHGTPTYVYSRASIIRRLDEFRAAFASLPHLIAYSVKANGNLEVLRLLARHGAGADIVSGGELHRALLAGIPPASILFSGVGKTVHEMAMALSAGIMAFNVESEGELRALSELARAMQVVAPVALRVNPDIESPTPHHYTRTGGRATKFGIPWESARSLYRLAAELPAIEIRGIDVHIGSQITDPEPYRLAIRRVLELVERLRDDGIAPEFLDVGGGFGIAYDEERSPAAQDFADVLVPELQDCGMRIVFEPGRFITGHAGALAARVLYIKEMGGRTFVITDAGMNDLLRPSHYASYHRIDPGVRTPGREVRRVDVVGPVCESGDFLALDRDTPMPQAGELLVVGTAGAYGFSMASTYNSRPRPAEVLVDGDGFRLIRRRENYDDLVRGEIDIET
jgi:diaminopimelate decarboxylase